MADSDSIAGGSVRWARIFAALIVLFAIAEIFSQAVVYYYAGKPFQSLTVNIWSPYGLVRNNPALTSPGFDISPNGFRSTRDYTLNKPPHTFRVLMLGGSVLYSGLVPSVARLSQYGRVRSDQTIAPYLEALLRKDPAFAGINVEVINAAVNFNRIVETSADYLEQYIKWQPDMVIVFGSVNNFGPVRYRGDFEKGWTAIQGMHPWRAEFDRLVLDNGLTATFERLWRTGSEHSATLALLSKGMVSVVDAGMGMLGRIQVAPPSAGAGAPRELETPTERAEYVQLYGGYADAMIAAARRMGQGIAFAWEPELGDMGAIKPLSAEEKTLYAVVHRPEDVVAQQSESRVLFHSLFDKQGIPIVDPVDDMRHYDHTVYIDYTHYTPSGNEFVAGVTYRQLRSAFLAQLALRKDLAR